MTPTLNLGILASGVSILGSRLFSWGIASSGALGNGTDTPDVTTPTQIGSDANWQEASAGLSHGAAVKDKKLFTWGSASQGELGDGRSGFGTTPTLSPTQVGSATDWQTVTAGHGFSVAIKTDGKLFAWGLNESGQLGRGNTTSPQASPVQIGSATDWQTVSANEAYCLAIKTDGKLFAWGFNGSGQLGDGTTTQRTSPVQIGSDTDWQMISSSRATQAFGGMHSLGIRDGKLFSWGSRANGRLGDGNTSGTTTSPTQVGSDTDWTAVAAGSAYSLGIRDGKLFAWGSNASGQLGDGTTTQRTSPVQIGSDTDWLTLAAAKSDINATRSFGIKTNGTLYAWGNNGSGRLGDGTTTNRTSPVQIGSATDWQIISSGNQATYGLR